MDSWSPQARGEEGSNKYVDYQMYILLELQCFKGNQLHTMIMNKKGGDPVTVVRKGHLTLQKWEAHIAEAQHSKKREQVKNGDLS